MTSDFLYANKLKVRQNSTQKISKPRMEVPDNVELHTYGSQSNNIYEWQKDQLRAKIENDKSHFYTYAKDYLSLAFPIVDENRAAYQEKVASEKKWLTKSGFDNKDKKTNIN